MDCNLIIGKARGRVSGMLSSFRDAENVCDSAPLSARIPFPHTEHDFLRNGIPQLAGKHGNLSAMVSVISDKISEKADRVWTKAFDMAVGRDGSAQDYAESFAALFHCPQSLRRSRAVGGGGGKRVLHGKIQEIEVYAPPAAEESVAQILTFA